MKPSNEHLELANFFSALSHKRRLMICDILIANGRTGMNFDQLCKNSNLTPSTLTHHLRQMEKGGIIIKRPKRNETWINVNFARIKTAPMDFIRQRENNLMYIISTKQH